MGCKRVFSSKNDPRIHVLFLDYDHGIVGVSHPQNSSPWPQGIIRLKFPAAAPSRSTLKLEEAFLSLMTEEERLSFLREGMVAVDLGAAPGGWTYQFIKRKIKVYAIDNGKLSDTLMASPLVRHRREDAYKYEPDEPVDWMVCDMVDRPQQVAELIGRWLAGGWTSFIIANLKLPMKNRHETVERCLQIIAKTAGPLFENHHIVAKQLYHDRDEITLMVKPKASLSF
jgi:23S rRNA (cytidine2498-2'-O)-methyltransferase